MTATVLGFFHEPTFSLSYLVWDPQTREAALIDPVLDYDHAAGHTGQSFILGILSKAHEENLNLRWILETHVHADHLTAAQVVKSQTSAPHAIGKHITRVQERFQDLFHAEDLTPDGSQFDRLLAEGDSLALGTLEIEVLETPGHTVDCLSYKIGDAIFVGDTLFMPDYGTARVDFPGGDASTLYRSIQKILDHPAQTRLFMCHDYKAPGRDYFAWETTVAKERQENIHIKEGISEADFVKMRVERDKTLDVPNLILPSLQVNMRAGHLPPAADNGIRYLLIPLNAM